MSDTYYQHKTKLKTPKQRIKNKTFVEYIKYAPNPIKGLMNLPELKQFIGRPNDDVELFKTNLLYFLRRKYSSYMSGPIPNENDEKTMQERQTQLDNIASLLSLIRNNQSLTYLEQQQLKNLVSPKNKNTQNCQIEK